MNMQCKHGKTMRSFSRIILYATIIGLAAMISGCYSFYVDRRERTVNITTEPQGAYVWDAAGTKFLGRTPIQLKVSPSDYMLNRIYLTQPGHYDEVLTVYDHLDGMGFMMLDACLVAPLLIDLITLSPGYGKFSGTDFHVNMTSTSIPRPGAIVQINQQQDMARAQAMIGVANSISQGANAFSAAMSQQAAPQPVIYNPSVQPANYATANTGASAVQTKTISYKRKCGIHDIEYDIRYGGCPTCKASKFGFGTEVKCNNCGYMHFAGKHCPVCNQ